MASPTRLRSPGGSLTGDAVSSKSKISAGSVNLIAILAEVGHRHGMKLCRPLECEGCRDALRLQFDPACVIDQISLLVSLLAPLLPRNFGKSLLDVLLWKVPRHLKVCSLCRGFGILYLLKTIDAINENL